MSAWAAVQVTQGPDVTCGAVVGVGVSGGTGGGETGVAVMVVMVGWWG